MSNISELAQIRYYTDKGMSHEDAQRQVIIDIENNQKEREIKKQLRKIKQREAARNYYRRKRQEQGLTVQIRVV
jgi:hypothetical protein